MAIDAEVRRLGLGSRVKHLGERRDVRRLLAGADLVAQANVEPEPFGVVFAEALLAGVPVVTTNMGGAPEIVDNSCGRLVAPGDLEALAAALDALISDASLRATLGAGGPAHAAARCDPSVVLPQLEAARCQSAFRPGMSGAGGSGMDSRARQSLVRAENSTTPAQWRARRRLRVSLSVDV